MILFPDDRKKVNRKKNFLASKYLQQKNASTMLKAVVVDLEKAMVKFKKSDTKKLRSIKLLKTTYENDRK